MPPPPLNKQAPEQAFLKKYNIKNARRADGDMCGIFRTTTDSSAPPAAGLFSHLGSLSFSMPTIERAPAEMESSSKGAALGKFGPSLGRRSGALTSPILVSAASSTQREVL